jgi:ATP-binding cassette subfamily B protein
MNIRELILRNPIGYLMTRMWQFAHERRRKVLIAMVSSATAMAVWLTIPLVLARFINRAQTAATNRDLFECGLLLGATVLLSLLAWAFHGPSRVAEAITSYGVRRNLQRGILSMVTRLPIKWHTEHHSGETIDRVAKAGSALADFSDASFMVLQLFTRFVVALTMMSIFLPQAAVIVLSITAAIVVVILAFDRALVPLYESGNYVLNRVASKVQDYLTNITTVISLRLEDRVIDEVDQQLQKFLPITRRTIMLTEAKWFCSSVLVDLMRVTTLLWFVGVAVKSGKAVELGTLVALNEYLTSLSYSFYDFTWKWNDLVIKATRLRAVEEIESDYQRLVGTQSSTRLPEGWHTLAVEDLSFRHRDNASEVAGIRSVNATFKRGKSYAVVGSSGSGKSTLLSILRGIHRADSGRIFCNGQPVADGLAAVAKCTTLIPQEPEVFADSVLMNITMGIDGSPGKIAQALEMARFDDVVRRLPKGLESNIAEKGVSLSGGEKQRLALARGIFFAFDSDSDIILLDESTSSVDITNERVIYEKLLMHFRSELILATTHKFNLLPLFDEIIVMKHGEIVERGTLAELVSQDGVLSTMWSEYSDSAWSATDAANQA